MTQFQRTKAIIAVFGSGETASLPLAEEIGFIIAKRKQILLTGGREPGEKPVKKRAIKGLLRADSSWPWIGVDRGASSPAPLSFGSGFVIDTDLGHRRNYLEACLCDAAIGLKGGDGTSSE